MPAAAQTLAAQPQLLPAGPAACRSVAPAPAARASSPQGPHPAGARSRVANSSASRHMQQSRPGIALTSPGSGPGATAATWAGAALCRPCCSTRHLRPARSSTMVLCCCHTTPEALPATQHTSPHSALAGGPHSPGPCPRQPPQACHSQQLQGVLTLMQPKRRRSSSCWQGAVGSIVGPLSHRPTPATAAAAASFVRPSCSCVPGWQQQGRLQGQQRPGRTQQQLCRPQPAVRGQGC